MPAGITWKSDEARDRINREIDQRWRPPVPPYVWYDVGETDGLDAIPPDALRDIILWCFGTWNDQTRTRLRIIRSRLMPDRHLLRLERPNTFPFRFSFGGRTHPVYQLGGVEELGEVTERIVNLRTLLPGPSDDPLALSTTRHNIP